MIITQKKPIEELMAMLGDAKRIGIIGCSSCATACATGGEKEIQQLKAYLESQGRTVVVTGVAEYCCTRIADRRGALARDAAEPSCRQQEYDLRQVGTGKPCARRKWPGASFRQL